MEKGARFCNFDEEKVFQDSRDYAERPTTRNFVVEFGKEEAQIAFDLTDQDVKDLLESPASIECPVRWMYEKLLSSRTQC